MGFILSDDWNSWTLLWKVWQQGSRYGAWTVDEGLYVGLQKKKTKRINWEWNELWKLWKWRIFSNKTTLLNLFQIVLEIKYINSWAYGNNSHSNYHCIFHYNLKNWLFIYLTLIDFCYYSRHEQFNIQLHSLFSILSFL